MRLNRGAGILWLMYGGIEGLLNLAWDGQNVRGESSGNWEGTRKYN